MNPTQSGYAGQPNRRMSIMLSYAHDSLSAPSNVKVYIDGVAHGGINNGFVIDFDAPYGSQSVKIETSRNGSASCPLPEGAVRVELVSGFTDAPFIRLTDCEQAVPGPERESELKPSMNQTQSDNVTRPKKKWPRRAIIAAVCILALVLLLDVPGMSKREAAVKEYLEQQFTHSGFSNVTFENYSESHTQIDSTSPFVSGNPAKPDKSGKLDAWRVEIDVKADSFFGIESSKPAKFRKKLLVIDYNGKYKIQYTSYNDAKIW